MCDAHIAIADGWIILSSLPKYKNTSSSLLYDSGKMNLSLTCDSTNKMKINSKYPKDTIYYPSIRKTIQWFKSRICIVDDISIFADSLCNTRVINSINKIQCIGKSGMIFYLSNTICTITLYDILIEYWVFKVNFEVFAEYIYECPIVNTKLTTILKSLLKHHLSPGLWVNI